MFFRRGNQVLHVGSLAKDIAKSTQSFSLLDSNVAISHIWQALV